VIHDRGDRWLLVDGRRAAAVHVAATRASRAWGLLRLDGLTGALWLPGTRSVHTVGMRFTIDMACCDADGLVVHVATLRPGRLLLPRRAVRSVLEAEAGAFARWRITPGAHLALAAAAPPPAS
jgi:uncharacterized membrane protein (UPF0127 family)